MTIFAATQFSEDIRVEKNDMDTLVGIHPDQIEVPFVGGYFPKLGVYTRISITPEESPKHLAMRLIDTNGDVLFDEILSAEVIDQALEKAAIRGIGGIKQTTIFSPFHVKAEGTIMSILSVDGKDIIAGILRVVVNSPDNLDENQQLGAEITH